MIDDIKPVQPAGEPSLQATPTPVQNAETIEPTQTPDSVVVQEHSFAVPRTEKKLLVWPLNRIQTIVSATAFVLLIGGGTGAALLAQKPKHTAVAKPVVAKKVVKVEPPKPTTVASTLSGLQVAPDVNNRPVVGVMVENSPDARPQSGLSQAAVVYEAIAEGGITRFLALYQDTQPTNIGPIRSARPYFVSWAKGYDAAYAHVGGSPDALQKIKDWGVRDLDQFANSGSYHRISTRYAPHNMYSGVDVLAQLAASKGYSTSKFTGFTRTTKETPAKVPTAKAIQMKISGPTYNIGYDYDAASNSYKRQLAGEPHLDADTNTQLSPKVVIGLIIPYGLEADGYHSSYTNVGTGIAYVFQNGTVTQGTWTKTAIEAPLTLAGPDGKPLALNQGQTWITAVATQGAVTYSP